MNIRDRFRRLFKLRFAVMYPFVIYFAIFSNPGGWSAAYGIALIIVGMLIRVWANGYAIKMNKLTTSGPYSIVRHPLYVGTALIAIGFAVMLNTGYIGALFIILTLAIYYRTIKKEEVMLKTAFGQIYLDYKKKVPAILPAIFPYTAGEKWRFSLSRLVQSQEYKPVIWIIIVIIAFHIKALFFIERQTFNPAIFRMIIAALILASIDIAGEIIKWKKRQTA